MLAFESIALILLGVIALVIAAYVFGKIWNVFIGSAAQEDASVTAKTISKMLADNKQYEQVPYLYRLQGNWVVGFGPNDQKVQVGTKSIDFVSKETSESAEGKKGVRTFETGDRVVQTNYARMYYELPRPSTCKAGQTCICSVDTHGAKPTIGKCSKVNVPEKTIVLLQSDYSGYVANANEQYRHTQKEFAVNADLEEYRLVGTTTELTQNSENNQLFPVIIEKEITARVNETNLVTITVLPDTQLSRTRVYTRTVCDSTSKDDLCKKKKPSESLHQGVTGLQYCAPSFFDGSCSIEPVPTCNFNREITAPCMCLNEIRYAGFCAIDCQVKPKLNAQGEAMCTAGLGINRDFVGISCDTVTQCSDYCLATTDPRTGETTRNCDRGETTLCTYNPCGIDTRCRVRDEKCVSQ